MKWLVASLSVFILSAGCVSVAPIPENISYVIPSEDIGDIGKFIGAWAGKWEGILGHGFYVEEVNPLYARVILSWGDLRMQGFEFKKGYKELQGYFVGNDLFVKYEQEKVKAEITYRLNGDATAIIASGKFELESRPKPYELKTIMHRVKNDKW